MIKDDLRYTKAENKIQQAFLTLLESHTFDKITVQMIAQQADINRSTFYAHYTDKYILLERWIEQSLRHLLCEHVLAQHPFGAELSWQLCVSIQQYMQHLLTLAPKGFRSILPLVEQHVEHFIQEVLSRKMSETSIPFSETHLFYVPRILGANLCSVAKETCRSTQLEQQKSQLLPLLYPYSW